MIKKPAKKLSAYQQQDRLFYPSVVMLVISVLVLCVALAVQQSSTKMSVSPAKGFPVGQAVTMGSATVKVESVKKSAGTPPFIAPDSAQYYIVTLYVKNNTDQPIQVLPSSDTYVKTASGNVAYLSPLTLDSPFKAGELPAGEAIRGELSYLASETEPSKLYIDAVWSGSVLPFSLSSENEYNSE